MKAKRLSKRARIAALSLDAYDGHLEPFDERLHKLRPHRGQQETSRNFRRFLEVELISRKNTCRIPIPFAVPEVHGATKMRSTM